MGNVWQASIVDSQGNVQAGANVEVREQLSGTLVSLYSDFALASPTDNPVAADDLGFVRFFVAVDGIYRITATHGGFSRQWTHVPLVAPPVGGYVPLSVLTPTTLASGNNNNWNGGLDFSLSVGRLRVEGHASGLSVITGMLHGSDGRRVILTNTSAAAWAMAHESGSSTAANRFNLNGDLYVPPGVSHEFIYEGAISRWSKLGN